MVVVLMLHCNKTARASVAASPVQPAQAAKSMTRSNDHDAHRQSQEGKVQRQQQQAGNQHPETQHRQEAEKSAQYEQQPDGNPQPSRRGLAQPAQAASRPTRKQSLPAIEVKIQPPLVSVGHVYTVPRPRSPAREWPVTAQGPPSRSPGFIYRRVQRRPALILASVAAPGQSCLSPKVLNGTGAVSRCACRSGASGSTYNKPVTISPRAWQAWR